MWYVTNQCKCDIDLVWTGTGVEGRSRSRDCPHILYALYLKNGTADFHKNSTVGKLDIESIFLSKEKCKKTVWDLDINAGKAV